MPAKPTHQKRKRAPRATLPQHPYSLNPYSLSAFILILPTLQLIVPTLQRPQHGIDPCRVAFFSLPAQRKEPKERAALPLRRPRSTGCGTGGAKTRCAQTACPFFPVPHPAARLSAKGLFFFPGNPPCPAPPSWRGQPSTPQKRGQIYFLIASKR